MLNIESAKQDDQRVTPAWEPLLDLIAGVKTMEIKNTLSDHSYVTEYYRHNWDICHERPIQHVVHVTLCPGSITAWHMHKFKSDNIVVPTGMIKLVLFDGRKGSSTEGKVNVFNMSPLRPMVVGFPPGIWHGFHNLLSSENSSFINISDGAYNYEQPDEWRLPLDTPEIPFTFS
jgi:dTDP-4-dehydrorhamnose 3,5-epimerase